MEERQNTLVCTFDPQSPRISVYEIHEWIHERLDVAEATVLMIQIDGPKRQVFVHFVDLQYVHNVLQTTRGQSGYKHPNGEISPARIEMAGMGTKRVRIVNLPPEIDGRTVRAGLAHYGQIRDIQEEKCSKAYRYAVANGVRVVVITLNKHVPFHFKNRDTEFWHPTTGSLQRHVVVGTPGTYTKCVPEGTGWTEWRKTRQK